VISLSKKEADNSSPFHENSLHVNAFLGGTMFAAMVLIIEFRGAFTSYSHWLIAGTALVSFLFIVSAIGNIHISTGKIKKDTKFASFIETIAGFGFLGLGVILPSLVFAFSPKGGEVTAFVEGAIMITFVILRAKAKKQ
jgi:hypothetical protein